MLLLFLRAGAVTVTRPISDFYVAGRLVPSMLNGMVLAAAFVPLVAFAWLAQGHDHSWQRTLTVLGACAGGLLLGGVLFAPMLRRFGGYTIPDFLAERFAAPGIRPLAALGVVLSSFPALAVSLYTLGLIATRIFPFALELCIAASAVVMLICILAGGMRSASLVGIAHYAVLLAAVIAGLAVTLWSGKGSSALDLASGLRLDALAASDPLNLFALTFCLATGTAAMPFLLARGLVTPTVKEAGFSFLWALGFAALLAIAAFTCGALTGPSLAAVSGRAQTMLLGLTAIGAIAACLAAGSGLALVTANALSYDIFYKGLNPNAPADQRLLVARMLVVFVAALAAIAGLRIPGVMIEASASCFSLAASALFPALLLGLWWKRASPEGALAGMLAGLAVCLYYLLAPRYMPFAFYETSSLLSNATPEQAARYVEARASFYMADPAMNEGALARWELAVEPIANWWGVRGVFVGLFAVPLGLVTMAAVSLFTRAPSADVQAFVEELRKPAV